MAVLKGDSKVELVFFVDTDGLWFEMRKLSPFGDRCLCSLYNLDIFDDLQLICKYEINFVEGFVVWTSPGLSSFDFLFEEGVHDFVPFGCCKIENGLLINL